MFVKRYHCQATEKVYLHGFLHPDSELKNQLSPSQSCQECAGLADLYKQKFSVV